MFPLMRGRDRGLYADSKAIHHGRPRSQRYFLMWSPSIPRASLAAAIIAALATCGPPFAPAVFAQPASDSFGQLLVGKAAFGDWRTDAPLVRRNATRSVSNP